MSYLTLKITKLMKKIMGLEYDPHKKCKKSIMPQVSLAWKWHSFYDKVNKSQNFEGKERVKTIRLQHAHIRRQKVNGFYNRSESVHFEYDKRLTDSNIYWRSFMKNEWKLRKRCASRGISFFFEFFKNE